LSDGQKTPAYDQYVSRIDGSGMGGSAGGAGADLIFRHLWHILAPDAAAGARVQRGSDLRYNLEITLEQRHAALKQNTHTDMTECESARSGPSPARNQPLHNL